MMYAVFLYLLKATLCLGTFSMVYRGLFAGLTHFQWMRFYLIATVALSVILPFIQVPAHWYAPFFSFETLASSSGYFNFDTALLTAQSTASSVGTTIQNQSLHLLPFVGYLLLGVYMLGILYKIGGTVRNLLRIQQFITRHHSIKEDGHYLVYLPQNVPAFSFWHYIFLNPDWEQLSADEQQQIKQHELVHVRQKHTLDLLFFEIAGALFWFNPLMAYLKKALREVHEYLADAGVAGRGEAQKAYAHLLLKLAIKPRLFPLANSISGKQIGRRIIMLTKTRSLPQKRFIFLLIFPMAVMLLLLHACLDEPVPENQAIKNDNALPMTDQAAAAAAGKKIRKIIWEGNTIYDDEILNRTLGLKTGDIYNDEVLQKHLNYNPDGSDVSTLYMDQGYLFFNIEVEEKQVGAEVVDLVFKVFEGQKSTIRNIIIKGNQTVSTSEIKAQIPIKSGDVFSRSKLIEAQKAIADMGYFDPQQVSIYPYPQWNGQAEDEIVKTDIEFTVIETNPKK